jgi:transposase-like protein
MKRSQSPFKWRHDAPEVTLLCVRRVQRYAPEINKRMRPHLKMSGDSFRIDETYVEVGTEWKYLSNHEH